MELLLQGLRQALWLLWTGDPEVREVALLTLLVSGSATAASLVIGVPSGAWLALGRFPGRRWLITAANAGMGLPPVTVGLAVMLCLWRSGPLGNLELLYTPAAMVAAQVVIALPVVVGLTVAALASLPPGLPAQLQSLGAGRARLAWLLLQEARVPLLTAVAAGFGSVISEVGASLMVGGNILGQTRVLTTAIVLEAQRGKFDLAVALSLLLLGLVLGVNVLLSALQRGRRAT
jgi:tungstate transport system permease protein